MFLYVIDLKGIPSKLKAYFLTLFRVNRYLGKAAKLHIRSFEFSLTVTYIKLRNSLSGTVSGIGYGKGYRKSVFLFFYMKIIIFKFRIG